MPNTKKMPQRGKTQKINLKKENLLLKRKIKNLKSTMERSHQLPVEVDRLRQSLAALFVAEQIHNTAMNEIFQWHQSNKERP